MEPLNILSVLIKSLALVAFLMVLMRLLSTSRPATNTAEPLQDEPRSYPPAAPELELHINSARQLRFEWQDVEGATHYQLLERPGPNSVFQPLGPVVQRGREQLIVKKPLHSRLNTQYVLRAYNDTGLADSCALSVSERLETKLRFLQDSGIDPTAYFGFSVNLSTGGRTLMIAEDDRSTLDANGVGEGSAYVFLRDGNRQWNKLAYIRGVESAQSGQSLPDIEVTPAEPLDPAPQPRRKAAKARLNPSWTDAARHLSWLKFNSP